MKRPGHQFNALRDDKVALIGGIIHEAFEGFGAPAVRGRQLPA